MLKVVISGVSLVQGGILSILQDSLKALSKIQKLHELDITVLVHSKTVIGAIENPSNFKFIEYPQIKSSWLRRLHFEYFESLKISDQLKPDLWISLHDITPNINCKFQVVYCHNPSVFYRIDLKYFFYDLTFSLFCLFYKYLYKINIKRNNYIIIQQNWIRNAFKKMYNVDTIVAYPLQDRQPLELEPDCLDHLDINFNKQIFFFPSIPRVFKNFEIVCQAAELLEKMNSDFEVVLTLDGSENKYAHEIFNKYNYIKSIKFIGIQKRSVIQALYNKADCLLFPSKLETWGLPVSEFKPFNRPILISDLPYAHENIGVYDKAKYFDPNNPHELSKYMSMAIEGGLTFSTQNPIIPAFPFFKNWDDLLIFLLNEAKGKKN